MKKIYLEKYLETEYKPTDIPDKIIGEFVDYECEVYSPNGELIVKYMKAPKEILDIARYFSVNTKATKSSRTRRGLPQMSSVFGVMPRNHIREDYCRFSKKCSEEKELYKYVLKYNELVSELYKTILPVHYKKAIEDVKSQVHSDYLVVDTPWSNVNVNLNQVIKYHKDSGNNKNDLSNVLIVRSGVSGGHLVCPELGVTLSQGDGWMTFFRGQDILHGVMPCKFANDNSYRSSIVNYTMTQLKNCYPYEDEMERLKEVKTRQARDRKVSLGKLKAQLERKKEKIKGLNNG